jgi:DnaJ-class molecular chaperone
MKAKKPRHNIFKDPSKYGTYSGDPGSPEQWAKNYSAAWDAAFCKTIIKEKTPYEILGIPTGSDWATIRHAYLKLIKANHPDLGGDVEICKEVIAAYTLLEDMRT